jgi:glucokinase-like ROK family protein
MLLRHEHVSRTRLSKLTGLSTTTITNLVSELLEQGIVTEEGLEQPVRRRGAGRPRTALWLVPEARYAIGVHIGVGSVRIAVADLRARLQNGRSLDHPLEMSPADVVRETSELIRQAIKESRVNPDHVVGVGIGASGLVNPVTGVNVVAPNLGWQNVPLADWFADQLDLPVCVDNNARAMALGEAWFGAGQDVHALAFVYARVGVGAGFVVGGQLFRGSGAGAGEIGHTTIIADGGKPCRCGNTGCLEALVSEPALVRQAEQLARQDKEGILANQLRHGEGRAIERIFAAARAGDAATRVMLEKRACYLGIGLANLVNILNPDLIILGGIYAQEPDLLLPVIEATVRQRAFANLGEQVQLQTASFGQQAGLVGAAALALDAFFYRQPERIFEGTGR